MSLGSGAQTSARLPTPCARSRSHRRPAGRFMCCCRTIWRSTYPDATWRSGARFWRSSVASIRYTWWPATTSTSAGGCSIGIGRSRSIQRRWCGTTRGQRSVRICGSSGDTAPAKRSCRRDTPIGSRWWVRRDGEAVSTRRRRCARGGSGSIADCTGLLRINRSIEVAEICAISRTSWVCRWPRSRSWSRRSR